MTEFRQEHTIWQLLLGVGADIAAGLAPTIRHYTAETGLEGWAWFTLISALTFEPEPATAAGFERRGPYSGRERHLKQLRAGAEHRYLVKKEDAFHLTAAGRAATQQFIDDLRTVMVAIDPLPANSGERLGDLLGRLVQASRESALDHFSLDLSFKLMPPPVPPLPFSEQAISCLAAFRDDAHVAAWQPSGLSGPALEALTMLWRGQADSLESLHKWLVRRTHPRQVYRQALAELRHRGYITGPDAGLVVTEAGRVYREEVETATDRHFFSPWSRLNAAELAELADLLIRLRAGFTEQQAGG